MRGHSFGKLRVRHLLNALVQRRNHVRAVFGFHQPPGRAGQEAAVVVYLGDNGAVMAAQHVFLAMLQARRADAGQVSKTQDGRGKGVVGIRAAGIGNDIDACKTRLFDRIRQHRNRRRQRVWHGEMPTQQHIMDSGFARCEQLLKMDRIVMEQRRKEGGSGGGVGNFLWVGVHGGGRDISGKHYAVPVQNQAALGRQQAFGDTVGVRLLLESRYAGPPGGTPRRPASSRYSTATKTNSSVARGLMIPKCCCAAVFCRATAPSPAPSQTRFCVRAVLFLFGPQHS